MVVWCLCVVGYQECRRQCGHIICYDMKYINKKEDGKEIMQEIIVALMNRFGYWGIMLLIAVENIFPPIPSEVILTFGGFMTTYTSLNVTGVILFSTLGSLLGAIVLYGIGRIFNKERLMKIVSGRIGKILRLKAQDIESAERWFEKRGNGAVFFCRFVPIVRSLISIPAGMSGMALVPFFLYTTAGSLIWNTVLVVVGSIVGENWGRVVATMDMYSHITLIVLVIVFVSLVGGFYYKKKQSQ